MKTQKTEKVFTSNKENTYSKGFPQFSLLQQWRHRSTENKMTFNILWNSCIGLHIVLDIMSRVLNKRWYWGQYIYNIHFILRKAMMKTNAIKMIRNSHFKTELLYIKSMLRCEIKIFLKEVYELWMFFKTVIFNFLLFRKKRIH